ncbi:MAG: polysaccharide biosynthesis/export family protein [Erythrobacter sp.]|nr:polysaccharide biosynthesis/export family protein [Erythrobacter sp.]
MMRTVFALLAGLLMAPLLLASAASAQSGYQIRPGDVLKIEVLEDPSMNRSTLVLPDGRISLPLAGVAVAAGRTIEQVQADLVNRLSSSFAAPPNVFVSIDRLVEAAPGGAAGPAPVINIYLMGEVAKPGRIGVAPGTTLLQLFAEMGGFSKFAAVKRIQLRRTDKKTGTETLYTFNYKDIERGANTSGNTVVTDGDIILVPQRKLFE